MQVREEIIKKNLPVTRNENTFSYFFLNRQPGKNIFPAVVCMNIHDILVTTKDSKENITDSVHSNFSCSDLK
jgi:hypothetical protein